jgi:hypothetical protein
MTRRIFFMARNLMNLRQLCLGRPLLGLPCVLGMLMLVARVAPAAAASAPGAQMIVHLSQTLSTISPLAIGVNDAVWDGHLQDAQVPDLLRADGVRVMRYPGGSIAENFHWQTNTLDDGSNAGTDTFDKFMQAVQQVGATPISSVNYGSGTPEEAAAWVKYANITRHYHIRYWEIGNEPYGNGTYGASWETDKHALGPTSYADNYLQFIQAMKAVDPFIQTGLFLTAPGNWPDGQTSASSSQPWNDTVLPIACSSANFVSIHWYPQGPTGETDAGLLAAPANGESTPVSFTPDIPSMVSTLHAKLNQYCGAHASAMQIMTTETNSVSYNPGKQTTNLVNALFLAEDYLTWLSSGVTSVDWWAVHDNEVTGTNESSSLYGTTNYGDYGLLSVGATDEPPVDTPFPDYYGLQMVSKVVGSFDQIVATSSNQSAVQVFAVRHRNGSVAVLLINTDPTTSYAVSISGLNLRRLDKATIYSYGQGSTSVSVSHARGTTIGSQIIAPYSLISPAGED